MQFRDERTQRVSDYETFKSVMDGRPGFVIAPWCGSATCEAQIKTDTQATIRNMPLGVPSRRVDASGATIRPRRRRGLRNRTRGWAIRGGG